MDPGTALRIKLKGEKLSGKPFTKTIMLTIGDGATGIEKLAGAGFEIRDEDGKIFIDNVMFASAAEKAGIDFDQEILNIQVPAHRLPKELMYFPAGALYILVWTIQNRRRKQQQPVVAT
jgi:C-terminal processing protease CtpA/Prc